MAWIEKRGGSFHLNFRFENTRFKKSLKTANEKEADELLSRVERRLRLIEVGDLEIPSDCDLLTFLLSDGKLQKRSVVTKTLTLEEVFREYILSVSNGSIEANTLCTLKIHLNHFLRILRKKTKIQKLNLADLQRYVNTRSQEIGRRGKTVSPVTIKKELASLSAVWTWVNQMGLLSEQFPKSGLHFPKTTEKPPFQTLIEVERQIARDSLTELEEAELWDCLSLNLNEIDDLLEFVRHNARHRFLFPMMCMAAHTGARRSELIRSEIRDFDFDNNIVVIRERKRSKGKRTTRFVPLSPLVRHVAKELVDRAEGRFSFLKSGKAISVQDATFQFREVLKGSKWEKIRGWHTFRHSFISNCAAKGIDQRIIDSWSGHQTEEMRRRYTHLFPDSQQRALESVFGRE